MGAWSLESKISCGGQDHRVLERDRDGHGQGVGPWTDEGTISECPPPVHVHPPSGRSPPLKAGSRNRDRQLQVINRSVYYPVTYTVESGSRDNQKYLQLLFAWPEVTGIVDS